MDTSEGNQSPSTPSEAFPQLLQPETPDTPKPVPVDKPAQTQEQEQCEPLGEDATRDAHPNRIHISPLQPTASAPAQRSSVAGGHRNSVTSPGPFSSWSAGSEMQLGYSSIASDTSGDRVFPIRSFVSVNPAPTSKSSVDDGGSNTTDLETRGPGGHRPSQSRQDTRFDMRRADTAPMSSTSGSPRDGRYQGQRRSALGEPISSIQAGAARHGSVAPLQFDIATSEKGTDESGALGEETDAEVAEAAAGLDSRSGVSQQPSFTDVPHVMTRFTHVETDDGHSVITGRDGTLQRCEDEPIHTPGAVQGFGALVALREENDGRFIVRYVSENSERLLGYSPSQLFRLNNFMDILTEEQQDNLLDHIDFIRDEDADPATSGPEVFSISVRPPKRKSTKFWCAIHISPAHPDIVICELELDDDQEHPLRPSDESTPEAPLDTLQANPSMEELEQSTEVLSKPLRILRSARKRRGEQGAMQVFDIMSQVQEQLASAPNLETFLKILIGIVKELTGFHRVMIYQFDSSFNGRVVSELVDPAHTRDLYHGLNFPASDIPRQARDLYKLNKVRLLYDRDLQTARIVCRTREDLETPLDMSHAYLRAMSPIHLKYLANMAVRASMSISINAFNELWGLIACHSYGNQGMRVSFPIRKMCRLVGDTASRNIERLSYASRLQARKLINTAPSDKNPSGYIIASSDDLLRLFDADFGLLSIKGETKIMGSIEQSQEALAMLEYLRMRKLTSVMASQDVREDFPDLRYPPGFQIIAGILYVPLSVGGSDFIVFFRKGQVKEVKWAGNPYDKIIRDGTAGYLEPRTSFKTWHETVIGKCREWNEEQIETAAVLCLVYGKFIEVWRQKEAAIQSSKLTRLLLANSAHEVRTPLNAIINYLEIALEGSLDQETRDNLARSHSASKSLIYVINDLLDLTKTEEGQELVKDEIFELPTCISEATEPFEKDSSRKGIEYEVFQHPGLPRFVYGDARRVRQAISNITANAISHTDSGFVKVEVFVSALRENQVTVDFVIADSGLGMSTHQLDALFRDLEQVSTEDSDAESTSRDASNLQKTRTLGLGLAVVARTVRNMDGQLRLKSEEGQGSRFVVQLPFQLADGSPSATGEESPDDSPDTIHSNIASAPAGVLQAPVGEMVLVERGSAMNLSTEPGRQSEVDVGSKGSVASRRSMESQGSHTSQQSDADRLIHAIQTPLSLVEKEPEYPLSRAGSKGSSQRPTSKGSTAAPGASSPQAQKVSFSPPTSFPRADVGFANVRDSKTPIRAVKIPDEFTDMPQRPQVGDKSGVLFELPSEARSVPKPAPESVTSGSTGGTGGTGGTGEMQHLQVLIAEDDPVNMKIMRKRLERAGHEVAHAVNGQDCAAVYKERSSGFDVVLMDMQMPIVDGLTSTKMIRSFEQTPEHPGHSKLAATNGRIPILAVSASLVEQERQTYIDAGFDGWILKPIDFKRLNTLLTGISEEETRQSCLYVPGGWEHGGWFQSRWDRDSTSSDEKTPTLEEEQKEMSIAPAAEEPFAAGPSPGSEGADTPTIENKIPGA